MFTGSQIAGDYRAYIRRLALRYGPQPDQRGQVRVR
jgi:hypothetical protein